MIFCNCTGTECIQQHLQIIRPCFQLSAIIGISNLCLSLQSLKDLRVAVDVMIQGDGILLTIKGLMGHDTEVSGVVNQGVTCNTGSLLICLTEAAVDDHQLAAGLQGGSRPSWS